MNRHSKLFLASLALGSTLFSARADWPFIRGPQFDGHSTEKVTAWPSSGPKVLWKVATEDGFSSFSIAGHRAFTLIKREVDGAPREVCLALDTDSGKELWAAPVAVAKYDGGGDDGEKDNKGGDGPRSTPTVAGDFVYVLDGRINLSAFEAGTGKQIWTKDLTKEYGGKVIYWQNAASPLVVDGKIYVCAGGEGQSLLALNVKDGSLAWKGESDKPTHATPTLATIHGVKQVVFFTQSGLVSTETGSGKVLWRYPFKFNVSTAASPIVGGDVVYCSAGYGVGSGAAKITKNGDAFEAKEIWRVTGNTIANHWSTPVLKDGYLYGMFQFKEYGTGAVKCVELATGKEVWSKPNFGPGQLIMANDHLVILSDRGELVLAKASPTAYEEIARAKLVEGKCWSTPTLSDGHIFARSTKQAACVDVSGKLTSR